MKRMILLAILAVAFSASAQPVQKKEAAKPEPVKEAAKPAPAPVAEAPKPAAQKPAARKTTRKAGDARHCLERPNNTEIIKCAEAYL